MTEVVGVPEWYLDSLLSDTAGFAALELIRRIIGSAKVRDITCIQDESSRAFAEKFCVCLAKDIIFHRESMYRTGAAYTNAMEKFLQ